MNFLTIVLRGLLRRPVRTGLTLLGISIGIAAVIALVGIARGFEGSWTDSLSSRGTDIVVSALGSAFTPAPFDESELEKITGLPHIDAICPIFVTVTSIEKSPMIIVSARQWGGFSWDNLELTSGRMPTDAEAAEVVLGTTALETLEKSLGDKIKIGKRDLEIVGVVDGGGSMENGSAFLALSLMQEITGNEGRINIIDIRLAPDTSAEDSRTLCATIDSRIPDVRAQLASEHVRDSEGFKIIQAMSWGTSLLAIFVGVLGVMNTMLMTVFERTQEICILLAIGWKRSRIVRMILLESALLGLFGGLLGVGLGVLGVKALETTPMVKGLLHSELSPELMGYAVIASVGVGVLSGLYPAWRSSRLAPSRAIQG